MTEQPAAPDVRTCERCGESLCEACVNEAAELWKIGDSGARVAAAIAWMPGHEPPHLCPGCAELTRLETDLDKAAVEEEWREDAR